MAEEILRAPVAVLHAPPGMDAVGVVTAIAERDGIDPVILAPAPSGDPADLEQLIGTELAALPDDHAPVALVLTRTTAWTLADQGVVLRCARRLRGCHLILVTGTEETFPVVPGVVLFSGRDLVLSATEVSAFLTDRGLAADPDTVAAMAELSGGWPGLLDVAVNAVQQWPVSVSAAGEIAEHAVQQEVRRRLVPWIPRSWSTTVAHLALAGSAGPTELTAARPHGPVPIAELVRHGLASPPHDDAESLRLLPPLSAVYVEELQRSSAENLDALRRQIADLRGTLKIADGGLRIAFEMRDWQRCAHLLQQEYPLLLASAPAPLIRSVLTTMPEAVLRNEAVLRLQAEIAGIPARGVTSVTDPAAPESSLTTSAITVALLRRRGDITRAARLIDRVDEAIGSSGPSTPTEEHVLWHLGAGFTRLLADDEPGAVHHFNDGWALRELARPGFPHTIAFYLALRASIRGEHATAARWVATAARERPPAPSSALDTRTLAPVLDLIRAVDALEERRGDPIPAIGPQDQRWVFAAWAEALRALTEHRASDALAVLEPPAGVPQHGLQRVLTAAGRANAYLALGQGNRVLAELEGFGLEERRTTVPRARLHLLTGDIEAALSATGGAMHDQAAPLRVRLELGLMHAAALLESGDRAGAVRGAEQVVAMVAGHDHQRVLLGLPAGSAEQLARLVPGLGQALESAYARSAGPLYPDRVTVIQLTDRERAVLGGLATTTSQDDLAAALHVSRNTVKSQLRSLYAKLEVHSREEALAAARRFRILD